MEWIPKHFLSKGIIIIMIIIKTDDFCCCWQLFGRQLRLSIIIMIIIIIIIFFCLIYNVTIIINDNIFFFFNFFAYHQTANIIMKSILLTEKQPMWFSISIELIFTIIMKWWWSLEIKNFLSIHNDQTRIFGCYRSTTFFIQFNSMSLFQFNSILSSIHPSIIVSTIQPFN